MGQDRFQVIYLTGAPATGKSTLLAALNSSLTPLHPFSYSKELADHISRRDQGALTQDDMRRYSAGVITPEDVDQVDNALIELVEVKRTSSHIVIDSHPVTKESYGFRVTAFKQEQLNAIRPTMIVVLYAAPETVIDRITKNNQGRPTASPYEAAFHNELQGSVALIYGLRLGIPVYFLDSDRPVEQLVEEIVKRAKR
ncbi:MAG: AAA family ATPase [Tepidisphaeraceae bacterium]